MVRKSKQGDELSLLPSKEATSTSRGSASDLASECRSGERLFAPTRKKQIEELLDRSLGGPGISRETDRRR